MTVFKVGDRIKVEFEGKIDEKAGLNFYMVEDKYGNRYDLPAIHLELTSEGENG